MLLVRFAVFVLLETRSEVANSGTYRLSNATRPKKNPEHIPLFQRLRTWWWRLFYRGTLLCHLLRYGIPENPFPRVEYNLLRFESFLVLLTQQTSISASHNPLSRIENCYVSTVFVQFHFTKRLFDIEFWENYIALLVCHNFFEHRKRMLLANNRHIGFSHV